MGTAREAAEKRLMREEAVGLHREALRDLALARWGALNQLRKIGVFGGGAPADMQMQMMMFQQMMMQNPEMYQQMLAYQQAMMGGCDGASFTQHCMVS